MRFTVTPAPTGTSSPPKQLPVPCRQPPRPSSYGQTVLGGRLGDAPTSLLVGERAAAGRRRDAGVRHAHRPAVRPAAIGQLLGRRPVVERAAAALPAAAAAP